MRLAALRTPRGVRTHVRGDDGYVDVADATGRAELADLGAALAAWPETRAAAERALGAGTDGGGIAPGDADFAPTVTPDARIFCVGRNYAAHVEELSRSTPEWPEIFARFPSCAVGARDSVLVSELSGQADYEGELAVVIGRAGRHVTAGGALDLVAGYTVSNDVSMRDWQLRGSQWTPGKNFDATLPIGPELVTPDEADAGDLALETRLNGEVVQSARTSQMLLDVPTLIEFLSSFTALRAGDVVVTGTPGGVALAREPRRFLRDGDVIEVTVERLGSLRNAVRTDRQAAVTKRWRELAAGGRG